MEDNTKLYPSEKIILFVIIGLFVGIPLIFSIENLAISASRVIKSNGLAIPLFTSFFGALISLVRRFRLRHRIGERKFIDILVNDFYFEDYATLSIISFVYGVAQGALLGGAFGFSLIPLIGAFPGTGLFRTENSLFASLGCLILLLIFRVLLEFFSILYRTAQDFGAYMREKKD